MKKLGRRKQLKLTPIDREAEDAKIAANRAEQESVALERQKVVREKNKYNLTREQYEALQDLSPKEKKYFIRELGV